MLWVRGVQGGPVVTRSAADILADLAALAARQAQLTAELAVALRGATVAPAGPETSPQYLTTAEMATHLGVSVRTLERLRADGGGPRFVRLGGAIRYPAAAPGDSTVQPPSSGDSEAPSADPRFV